MDNSNPDQGFLSASNAIFIAELQQRWQRNPDSVSPEWAAWFRSLDGLEAMPSPSVPSWGQEPSKVIGVKEALEQGAIPRVSGDEIRTATLDSILYCRVAATLATQPG